jgi:hypothetical protein
MKKSYREDNNSPPASQADVEIDSHDFRAMDCDKVADCCREATDRYFNRLSYDDRSCLELFRRALQEQDQYAWKLVFEQYDSLVLAWVSRHPAYGSADEDQEFFMNRAFANFWRAFNRDPHKFSQFDDLRSLLQYLKLCVFTAVQEYVERKMESSQVSLADHTVDIVSEESDPIIVMNDRMLANAVWEYVSSALKSEQESIVAREFLLYDMKPREIYARYEEHFSGVGQVRRVKGNLMARLRRDQQLLHLVESYD